MALHHMGEKRAGIEYGIRSEDGTAYFQEKQGGSSLLLIEEIPAGTYRLYVKTPRHSTPCRQTKAPRALT